MIVSHICGIKPEETALSRAKISDPKAIHV